MSTDEMGAQPTWQELVNNINVSKRGSERAVRKPLLLLMLLARAQQGQPREVSFAEIDSPLQNLLQQFGPPRKSYDTELPFWHLQNDGFWVVRDADSLPKRKGK